MRFSRKKGVFALASSRRIALKKASWLGLLGCAFAFSTGARAQEALRMSLASEEMAEARHNISKLDDANMKIGPITARLQATYGMEYCDNVNFSSDAAQSDFAVRPGINFAGLWPITDNNNLYFSTGLGYLKYFRYDNLDSFYITPDSAVAFQMYAGDFVFDFHDRFSWTENGSQTPSISSLSDLGEIKNSLGTKTDWDLNKLILSAGYDHDLLASTTDKYKKIDRQSELFSGRAALEVNPLLKTGLDVAGGLTAHDEQKELTDSSYFSAGPFIEVKLSQYITTTLAAGYVNYYFDKDRIGSPGTRLGDSFYARWNVTHRVNSWLTHTLSLQHDRQVGDWYDLSDLYSANYWATWTMIHNVTLRSGFTYYNGKIYNPGQTDDMSWYGLFVGAQWQISPKFSASAQYQLSIRKSDQNNGYDQNRLALALTYTF